MNVKICKICGKIGLDQMDFPFHYRKNIGFYYYKVMCLKCDAKGLTTGKRGRPVGYAMSVESRKKSGKTRTGYKQSLETKDKISASVIKYYKKLNPISDEMLKYYIEIGAGAEALRFLISNKEVIDSFDDVKTERSLRNKRYYELEFKDWCDYNISDTVTPELLIMLKEEIEDKNE